MNTGDNRDLYRKIEDHPGSQILAALRAYGTSVRTLGGNCVELRHLICTLEDPADPAGVLPRDRRRHCYNLLDEAVRLFHNLLTSIATLVEHTRNLRGEDFVNSEHRKDYQTVVDTVFANDPFAQFMRDFRNYVTHRAIPIVGLTVRIGSEQHISKLEIDLERMADWSRWRAPIRKFIELHRPKVRMLKLVDDYEQKSKAFNEQFGAMFQHHYEAQINSALLLMREWNEGIQVPKNAS